MVSPAKAQRTGQAMCLLASQCVSNIGDNMEAIQITWI